MAAKVRLVTRRFDLSVEGDSVDQVGALIDALEARGLSPKSAVGVAGSAPQPEPSDAQTASVGPPVGPSLDLWGSGGPTVEVDSGGAPSGQAEVAAIQAVTRRSGDMFVLRPKFPPTSNGAERVEDAAVVILGAFDASGERAVTGYRLVASLRQTGYALERVDKPLDELRRTGQILVDGRGRGRRYMLSEAGRDRARNLATELSKLSGRTTEATQ